MEKLPEISDIHLSVMEHYKGIAKQVFPEKGESFYLDQALTWYAIWADEQYTKANCAFTAAFNAHRA